MRLSLSEPLLIIGAGGHASVLLDVLQTQEYEILGVVSPNIDSSRKIFSEIRFYSDDDVLDFDKDKVKLINGLGSLPGCRKRKNIHKYFLSQGYQFASVISDHAFVSPHAVLGKGVQIMNGAIVQAGAVIGDNTIINSNTVIEHDCHIGANNHIAPGVTLSGGVTTKKDVHIGTGAVVIQSLTLNEGVIIGAGAVATHDIKANVTLYPAKGIQKGNKNES